MAEFTTVLKQLRRMCANNACNDCPVCDKYCRVLDMIESEIERVVMHWAAENSEPQYPTWNEWWCTNFPNADRNLCPRIFELRKMQECPALKCDECRAQPIPAEIANKLGIKPKG